MELDKYKVCPECGKHNAPSLLECRYCEADLTGIKVVDESTETQHESIVQANPNEQKGTALVRICSECGAVNAPQARKCKACGEDISDILPVHAEQDTKKAFSYELKAIDDTFSIVIDKPLVVLGREAMLKEHLGERVYVSRQHARLTVVAGKVFIENLSQTNKTFINNEEICDETPTAVNDGDEIGLGGKVIDGNRQDKAAYLVFRVKT